MSTMTRLGLVFAITATGCVAKDDSFGMKESQSAGDALGAGIEESAGEFGKVSDGAAADTPCVTLSGDTADSDGDSIPAGATLTFNCSAMAFGYTGMLTGTFMVTDDQPNAAAWAFTGLGDFRASLTGPFGGTAVRDQDGQIIGAQSSAAGPFSLHRVLDATTVLTTPAGRSTTVTEDNDWTITYTPQVTWTPGMLAVTGSLAAAGTWNVSVGNREAMATLDTPTPLTLDPACATRVTAGTATGTWQAGSRMRSISVTWSGCGQRTVTYSE